MRMERKYVRRRRIVAAILFLAVWAAADYFTTPKQCRVPLEQMSQFCKDLRYP